MKLESYSPLMGLLRHYLAAAPAYSFIYQATTFYIRNAILKKDGDHPVQKPQAASTDLVMERLSDHLLNIHHKFSTTWTTASSEQ